MSRHRSAFCSTNRLFLAAAWLCGCATQSGSAPPTSHPVQSAQFDPVEVRAPLAGDNPRYPLIAAAPPGAGQSVTDARLGTKQTRVSQTERLRHEYSRHDPFNSDRSMILLQFLPEGAWRVYRTAAIPYDQGRQFVRTIELDEPRWDASDPDALWGFREFRVLRSNVRTGESVVVKDFSTDPLLRPIIEQNPDLYRVTMKDEGEPSQDMRYWAVFLQGSRDDYRMRWIVTWDRIRDQVLGLRALAPAESRIDWVGMSPRGTWVLIGADYDNGGGLAGLTLADRALTTFHQLDRDTAHADVGFDTEGREVIVMQNNRTDYVDMIPISPDTRPVDGPDAAYEGSGRVRLLRLYFDSESPLGLNSGIHVSCNSPGYCVVSAFTEPGRPEQNWLDRTIALIRLDRHRPRVFYLAKVHGTAGTYWEETQASISRDGRKVVWATNWNRSVGEGRVWIMEMDIPRAWLSALAKVPASPP